MLAMILQGCKNQSAKLNEQEAVSKSSTDSIVIINDISLEEDNKTESEPEELEQEVFLTEEEQREEDEQVQFVSEEISDEIFDRIYGKSFKEDCTIKRQELRYLQLGYVGFDGESHTGEMIVNEQIADKVLEIFKKLYEAGYQIEKIKLVDEYDADDERSMADNNSSAFNFRFISHTTTVSKHGLGLAIDINPLYNPYIKMVDGVENIEPANATEYVNRDADFDHKIDKDDLAYKLFTEAGFTWGGSWKNSKDYQHFEINLN